MQLFVAYFGLDLPAGRRSPSCSRRMPRSDPGCPGRSEWAAEALRLPAYSRMIDVIMPQAFKLSLPATVGFLVQLLKGTSLAAIVGFIELTRAGTIVSNQVYSR
jgi:polar amino acid transport system permease protein